MTSIEQYLRDNGPQLSSQLISYMKFEGVTNEAIRKRLSRLKPPIKKLGGFFADNQTLFYLQEQYNKPEYFEGVRVAFQEAAKRYYSVIKAIEFHHGYLKKEQVASFSFSPVSNLKGHKNIKNVISDLVDLKILIEDSDSYTLNSYISFTVNENSRYSKGVEMAKETILLQFYSWARKIGLVSYESGKFHSEFAKFQWAFVAPSYISGIIRRDDAGKPKPAFVVADILIGNSINDEEVAFFIRKIEAIKQQKISNFLPFLILEGVSESAFKELKSKGVIVGFVNQLFGSEYEELIKSLISTVTNAGAVLKSNPESYIKLIEQLNKLVEGKTYNLRGDLFELAVGYYHSNLCQNLDIGKKIISSGEQREIDVFANYQSEIRIAECKAYKYELKVEQVDTWLTKKIPIIYSWLKEVPSNSNKKIVFEIWSTGGFSDEALTLLKSKSENTKKYGIEFYGEQEILEMAQKSRSQKIVDIMREYFIREK